VQDAVNLGWKLAQVVKRRSPQSLLDTYHTERHLAGARVLRNTMMLVALRRTDERSKALGEEVAELLEVDEARRRKAAEVCGLAVRYECGEGHPLVGRRIPDLDLVTAEGAVRMFALLHEARPVIVNLGEAGSVDIGPWSDRVRLVDAIYAGPWELPGIGAVPAPSVVLIRPDGHVAWVGESTNPGFADAMSTWLGAPAGLEILAAPVASRAPSPTGRER
jgi:3-(3-hydroxy-phenyl)propionate hydroxylase